MDERLLILPQPIRPSERTPARSSAPPGKATATSFEQVLGERLQAGPVRFSRHAAGRLESRGIRFSAEDISRLQTAVELAHAKGARDSLVLLGETALVVSVKNNTVVTVVAREGLKGNVFTNIDSAVIA